MVNLFKASAGSGKTYTLTLEYLRFLFSSDENYKHILAVTFTNKATEEMKERILTTLFRMAYCDLNNTPSNLKGIFESIAEYKGLQINRDSFELIKESALKNLKALLHDFSSFSVSTIDRFFQGAIRAFAREIGRNSSYNIELDNDTVINKAVDNMLANLDKDEYRDLLEWLIIYSLDSIESGSYWDIRRNLISMASLLTKEEYKLTRNRSSEKPERGRLVEFRERLKQIKLRYESESRELALNVVKVKERFGLDWSWFKYSGKYIKLESYAYGEGDYDPKICAVVDSFEDWVTKTLKTKEPIRYNAILEAYEGGLNEAIGMFSKYVNEREREYISADLILDNIHLLALLSDIDSFVKEYVRENNLMLLSDSGELLQKIIDGSDTPFIYEKIGTRIDNFMLDEFQDTSLIQWENFKPLIVNSIAMGYENLVVGDVKQSIYRWRGSDRELITSGIERDLGSGNVSPKSLLTNYRSGREIVEFNNGFFTFAAESADSVFGSVSGEESAIVREVYSDVRQSVPSWREGGHVKVSFFKNEESESGRVPWYVSALNAIPGEIERLLSQGYGYRDITILVRVNSEGATIIEHLLKMGYPVMSGDSLIISSNPAVEQIVSVLRYLASPSDAIAAEILFRSGISSESSTLSRLHLPELCQQIAGTYLKYGEEDSIFIASFIDIVTDYVKNEGGNISDFLDWWDLSGFKKSISSPPKQDAINIMTIHKAKGLSLSAVIIPFADWSFKTDSRQTLWVNPSKEPFNMVGIVPVKNSKRLIDSIFRNDFMEEEVKSYIDTMNIAYVAFTRASGEMVISAPLPSPNSKKGGVPEILYNYVTEGVVTDLMVYEFGMGQSFSGEISDNELAELPLPLFRLERPGDRVKIKLKADLIESTSPRVHGLVMHEILSEIKCEDELDEAIANKVASGDIDLTRGESIKNELLSLLASVRERGWFTGRFRVMNESEIILPGGGLQRPDRVMIESAEDGGLKSVEIVDFKFGELKSNKHLRQIEEYVATLSLMGFKSVKGYIWYASDGQILEAR